MEKVALKTGEKASVTHFLVESRSNVKSSREGKDNEWFGKRQKKQPKKSRGSERRWRQNAMTVGTFEGRRRFVLQESVQVLPEPQKSPSSSPGVHRILFS